MGKVISLPALMSLPSPIASHPDTLAAQIGEKLFIYSDYSAGAELFSSFDIGYEKIAQAAGSTYPLDTRLNCFLCGKTLFCRRESCAPEILCFAENSGISISDTNQGYAHCAALAVPGGIITADKNIAESAEKRGDNVLNISDGDILLPGYACGFIGGAGGVIGTEVFFFGDPLTHRDGKRITGFISSLGLASVSLFGGELVDFGGILVLDY